MKAIMVMYDSLNRPMLSPYGLSLIPIFFGLYAYDYEDGKQWSEFTDLKLVFSDGKEDVNQQQ